MRRAVSAAYYALFHHLCEAAVRQIAPYASATAANPIHRWLNHGEMRKICSEFASSTLNPPLRNLLGNAASEKNANAGGKFHSTPGSQAQRRLRPRFSDQLG